jgi:hypothetical protein
VAKPDGTTEPCVPTLVVKGHAAHTDAIAVHPTREHIFCSAAYSDKVNIWDADAKSQLGRASVKGRQATCCEFRGDGKHLAIGTLEGCVFVFRELNDWEGDSLRLARIPEMGSWPIRDCAQGIVELRYSPDLRTLAVASREQVIDLYDCADSQYLRLARCRGHSASVLHLDWSLDSKMIQSQCNAYEVLYWNTDRGEAEEGWKIGQPSPIKDRRRRENFGRQILDEQRDQQWATVCVASPLTTLAPRSTNVARVACGPHAFAAVDSVLRIRRAWHLAARLHQPRHQHGLPLAAARDGRPQPQTVRRCSRQQFGAHGLELPCGR